MANPTNEAIVAIYRMVTCSDEFQRQIYGRQAHEAVNKLIEGRPNDGMTQQEVPDMVQTLENQGGVGPDQAAINRKKGYTRPFATGDDLLLSETTIADPELSVAKAVGKSGGDSKAAIETRAAGNSAFVRPDAVERHEKQAEKAAKQAVERAEKTAKAVNPDLRR